MSRTTHPAPSTRRLPARRGPRPSRGRWAVLTTALLALCVSALAAAPAAGAAARSGATGETVSAVSGSRAMWVWDTSTPQATVDLAVSSGIGQLFVAVPPNLGTSSQLA